MTIKITINGYGRIGKNILRSLYKKQENIKIVGINDLGKLENNAHLTKYDSTHGELEQNVDYDLIKNELIVGQDRIRYSSETDPEKIPWSDLDVDVVLECTGFMTSREQAKAHLKYAKKVIISAPSKDADKTIVYGINHQQITEKEQIISNASCTTNCLAVILKPLQKNLGIQSGLMTTIHSFTNDQCLIDSCHNDLYRARSATTSLIPTSTGAAKTIGLIIPELDGRLDGLAVRVPTNNVSLVDLSLVCNRETTVDEVNAIMEEAAKTNEMKNILDINKIKLVSIDFNKNEHSAVFDTTQTKVQKKLIKVMAWYDNESGFSRRMIDCVNFINK